jgi:hypothetical protein
LLTVHFTGSLCHFIGASILPVLQVLQQLPEGLAIAVLAAAPVDLERQLSILPASLHPLAVEAALPSICRDHSLTLDFDECETNLSTFQTVLRVTSRSASTLRCVQFKNIPVVEDYLLQQIAGVCKTAPDVRLSFGSNSMHYADGCKRLSRLGNSLCRNTALTSLHLTFDAYDLRALHLDSLLKALTGLQSLSLAFNKRPPQGLVRQFLPSPGNIIKLHCLTRLCVGPGFHEIDLSQIVPDMTSLRSLCIKDPTDLQVLPALSPLSALHDLELQQLDIIYELPPLDTLTALQTLTLINYEWLHRLPPMHSLRALQTLTVRDALCLHSLPPLATLTALQTLTLTSLPSLQQLPPLETLTALQTLDLSNCCRLLELPPVNTLAELQTLRLSHCENLQQLPPLDHLTALQILEASGCLHLQCLQALDSLTSLETVDLSRCYTLRQLPPVNTLTELRVLKVTGEPQ